MGINITADLLVEVVGIGWAVVDENRLVALLGIDHSVRITLDGSIDRGDGWHLVWDKDIGTLIPIIS